MGGISAAQTPATLSGGLMSFGCDPSAGETSLDSGGNNGNPMPAGPSGIPCKLVFGETFPEFEVEASYGVYRDILAEIYFATDTGARVNWLGSNPQITSQMGSAGTTNSAAAGTTVCFMDQLANQPGTPGEGLPPNFGPSASSSMMKDLQNYMGAVAGQQVAFNNAGNPSGAQQALANGTGTPCNCNGAGPLVQAVETMCDADAGMAIGLLIAGPIGATIGFVVGALETPPPCPTMGSLDFVAWWNKCITSPAFQIVMNDAGSYNALHGSDSYGQTYPNSGNASQNWLGTYNGNNSLCGSFCTFGTGAFTDNPFNVWMVNNAMPQKGMQSCNLENNWLRGSYYLSKVFFWNNIVGDKMPPGLVVPGTSTTLTGQQTYSFSETKDYTTTGSTGANAGLETYGGANSWKFPLTSVLNIETALAAIQMGNGLTPNAGANASGAAASASGGSGGSGGSGSLSQYPCGQNALSIISGTSNVIQSLSVLRTQWPAHATPMNPGTPPGGPSSASAGPATLMYTPVASSGGSAGSGTPVAIDGPNSGAYLDGWQLGLDIQTFLAECLCGPVAVGLSASGAPIIGASGASATSAASGDAPSVGCPASADPTKYVTIGGGSSPGAAATNPTFLYNPAAKWKRVCQRKDLPLLLQDPVLGVTLTQAPGTNELVMSQLYLRELWTQLFYCEVAFRAEAMFMAYEPAQVFNKLWGDPTQSTSYSWAVENGHSSINISQDDAKQAVGSTHDWNNIYRDRMFDILADYYVQFKVPPNSGSWNIHPMGLVPANPPLMATLLPNYPVNASGASSIMVPKQYLLPVTVDIPTVLNGAYSTGLGPSGIYMPPLSKLPAAGTGGSGGSSSGGSTGNNGPTGPASVGQPQSSTNHGDDRHAALPTSGFAGIALASLGASRRRRRSRRHKAWQDILILAVSGAVSALALAVGCGNSPDVKFCDIHNAMPRYICETNCPCGTAGHNIDITTQDDPDCPVMSLRNVHFQSFAAPQAQALAQSSSGACDQMVGVNGCTGGSGGGGASFTGGGGVSSPLQSYTNGLGQGGGGNGNSSGGNTSAVTTTATGSSSGSGSNTASGSGTNGGSVDGATATWGGGGSPNVAMSHATGANGAAPGAGSGGGAGAGTGGGASSGGGGGGGGGGLGGFGGGGGGGGSSDSATAADASGGPAGAGGGAVAGAPGAGGADGGFAGAGGGGGGRSGGSYGGVDTGGGASSGGGNFGGANGANGPGGGPGGNGGGGPGQISASTSSLFDLVSKSYASWGADMKAKKKKGRTSNN